jgi:hypothetical protein
LSLLPFDRTPLSFLALGLRLTSLEQLISGDLILILYFLLLIVRHIDDFVIQLKEMLVHGDDHAWDTHIKNVF